MRLLKYLITCLSIFFMNFTIASAQVYQPGVSHKLAKIRKEIIKNLNYHIYFSIPDKEHQQINGHIKIEFDYFSSNKDLILEAL